jgi:hypothetical protein
VFLAEKTRRFFFNENLCVLQTQNTHISYPLDLMVIINTQIFSLKIEKKKLIYKKTIQVVFVTQTHISYPHVVLYFFVFQQK